MKRRALLVALAAFAPICGLFAGQAHPSWAAHLPGEVRGVSAVDDSLAIVSLEAADGVAALDLRSGRELWFRPLPAWNHSTPVVLGRSVIVSYGRSPVERPPGGIAAFDISGKPLWKYSAPSGMMSTPLVAGQSVFGLEGAGCIVKLSAADGRVLAHECLGSSFGMTMPRLFDGQLYVGGNEGSFWAIDTLDARPVWRFRSDDFTMYADAPAAAAHGTVIASALFLTHGHNSFGELPLTRMISAAFTLARNGHVGEIFSQKWDEQYIAGLNPRDGTLKWGNAHRHRSAHLAQHIRRAGGLRRSHNCHQSDRARAQRRSRNGRRDTLAGAPERALTRRCAHRPAARVCRAGGRTARRVRRGEGRSRRRLPPGFAVDAVHAARDRWVSVFAAQTPVLYAEPAAELDGRLRKSDFIACNATH